MNPFKNGKTIIFLVFLCLMAFIWQGYKAQGVEAFLKKVEKRPLTQAEWVRLKKGEILVSEESKQEGQRMRYVLAKVWIDRSPSKVWKALRNQEILFKDDPHMKEVEVVKTISTQTQHIAYTLSVSRLFPAFHYITQVNFLAKGSIIKFARLSGSFKDFKGFAKLRSFNHGQETVMIYALQLDSGPLLPQFLVRSVLKSGLPDLMRNIRKRVHNQNPCIQPPPTPCPRR